MHYPFTFQVKVGSVWLWELECEAIIAADPTDPDEIRIEDILVEGVTDVGTPGRSKLDYVQLSLGCLPSDHWLSHMRPALEQFLSRHHNDLIRHEWRETHHPRTARAEAREDMRRALRDA